MQRRGLAALLVLSVSLAGCVDLSSAPGWLGGDGLETPSFDQASLLLEGTDCREAKLSVPANATRLARHVPEHHVLQTDRDGRGELAVTATACSGFLVNGTGMNDTMLVQISAHLKGSERQPGPHLYTLWTLASNETLARTLTQHGWNTTHVPAMGFEQEQTYAIASTIDIEVPWDRSLVRVTGTAVSIETETRFGSDAPLGSWNWHEGELGDRLLYRDLAVTDVGAISGDLWTRPGSLIAGLMNATSQAGAGHQASFSLTAGVFER